MLFRSFMTEEDDEEFVDGTYDAEGGENAVIVQPGVTDVRVPVRAQATGPTLFRMVQRPGEDRLHPEPCEFGVTLREGSDDELQVDGLAENKIAGTPIFMQGDDTPDGGPWHQLLQLDSSSVPFYVNFGDAGVGYAFLHEDGDRGKFLWQCA